MKFLLIAYDYPPTPSPQSLRWAYLTRELGMAGHEVHVLTPAVAAFGPGGLPDVSGHVRVHRVFPGPLAALLACTTKAVRERHPPRHELESDREIDPLGSGRTDGSLAWRRVRALCGAPVRFVSRLMFGVPLNLKGLAVEFAKRLWGWPLFPDYRAEWVPWAERTMNKLLHEIRPDVVITSHEPAISIPLGLKASRRGFKWVADLGDPILAPYTPRRWAKYAFALEGKVWRHADLVTVTSEGTRELLVRRHGLSPASCEVLTQGFDSRFRACAQTESAVPFLADRLELLYTGSFYQFRRIGKLLEAVIQTPHVRLSIASANAPNDLEEAARRHPGSIRMLGFLPHLTALSAQRDCDVLVNLANEASVQVPGKLYEYLGSSRPILHIGGSVDDAAFVLLQATGAGVCESDDSDALRSRLMGWAKLKRGGRRPEVPQRSSSIDSHSWQSLAAQLAHWSQGGTGP